MLVLLKLVFIMRTKPAPNSAFYRWLRYWVLSFPFGIPIWEMKIKELFWAVSKDKVDRTSRGLLRTFIHMIILFSIIVIAVSIL